MNHTSESKLEHDYKWDTAEIKRSAGAFDGENVGFIRRVFHPTVSDIGPGSIKILTAIQIIKQYQDTPQGKALGLDQYKLTDLKALASDLNDRNNSLSIKIAALVVLNGQKFFSDKSIDGIPWAKLTKEQQDAALTAYYTLGEHAVSVDMAKNEFLPFTSGAKVGKVGPWILFGNNYSNLNAILAKGRSLGLSVAPVPRPKPSQKASSKYTKHAQAGAVLPAVRKVLDALPADSTSIANIAVDAAHAPAAKYMAAGGSLPQALAPQLVAAILAEVNRRELKDRSLAQGRPGSLVNELQFAVKHKIAAAPWIGRTADSTPVFTRFSVVQRQTLPSIAPTGPRARDDISTERFTSHHFDPAAAAERKYSAPIAGADKKIDPLALRGALEELLERQGRLPPSGASAFDPLLTPAWPGLQLPA